MKNYCIGICFLLSMSMQAQIDPMVGQLIEDVQSRIAYDTTVIASLEVAEQSLAASTIDLLFIKSTLAEALLLRDDRQAFQKSKEAVQWANNHHLSTSHPYLASAYLAQMVFHKRRLNFEEGIEVGEKIWKGLPQNTRVFDRMTYLLVHHYGELGLDVDRVGELVEILQNKQKHQSSPATFFYSLVAAASYNYNITQISEKSTIIALMALNHSIQDPLVLLDCQVLAINSLISMGQYQEIEDLLTSFERIGEDKKTQPLDRGYIYQMLAGVYLQLPLITKTKQKSYIDKAKKLRATFEQQAPRLAAMISFREARFVYNYGSRKKAKEILEGALDLYGDVGYVLRDWVIYCSHHTKEFDYALEGYQKMLERSIPGFEAKDVFENPDLDVYGTQCGMYNRNVFRWKCRTLYQKALVTEDEEEAIFLLKEALKAGLISAQQLDNYFELYYPYEFSHYTHQPWQHATLGFLKRACYQLYKRTNEREYLDQMFEFVERSKGLVMNRMLSKTKLPPRVAATIHQHMFELQEQERRFQLEAKEKTPDIVEAVYHKVNRIDAYMDSIRKAHLGIRFEYEPVQYANASAVQTTLKDDEVFIQYKELWSEGYAYLITRDTQYVVEYSSDEEDWKRQVQIYNKLLQNPLQIQVSNRQKIIKYAHQMYQMLLAPFEEQLAGKKHLIIAADRDLFHLPFESLLPTDEVKPFHELDFLVKRFSISYHSSATLYLHTRQKESVKDESMLAFAPVFNDPYQIAAEDRSVAVFSEQQRLLQGIKKNTFSPLPNTEEEVMTIAHLVESEPLVLLKEQARKNELKAALEAQPYQFVHIATHGFVNYFNPTLCALACYNKDGLGNDNFLYASEIENLQIKADLMILSSCESGVGRIIEGESLMALNRSFLIAGAKNVMYSLWKVNDEQTKNLMIDFYQFYKKDSDYSEALRKAKLKMLANPATANPRFWSAFILMGKE